MKAKSVDVRTLPMEKAGCYYALYNRQGEVETGFCFFDNEMKLNQGDVFIYHQGDLWRIKRA